MAIEDPELVAEFVIESSEHLADIENELLEIEQGGANVDADLVNKVFRGIHSIKGAAGFLGLVSIKELAHSLENVLNKIRSNELTPTSDITNVMLRAGDTLQTMLDDALNSNDVDVSDQIASLNAVLEGNAVADSPSTEAAPEAADQCETSTSVDQPQPAPPIPQAEPPKPAEPALAKEPVAAAKPADQAKPNSAAAIESSIRVPVGVLDQLMNLAGELVLSRNQLLQAVASNNLTGLDSAATDLDQVTSSLQEAIMQTRMQPIGAVFGKFPRIVRDLSSQLGKKCKLEVDGNDVEVDKTIIEAIGDPLTHLIRNSVDHGVELPEVRAAAGKEAEGTVWLRAFHKAGKVCIEIQDDGAGINPDKLKQKAVDKGVISPDRAAQMSDREAIRLIFHPGFSTAEKLSDVSGRGVGMDVVRTNIEGLGGNVDVESEVGVGSNIRVTLPLTLAIIPSMIVTCGEDRYAVPQANVAELVRLRSGEVATRIDRIKNAEVLRLRGSLLPLVRLDSALGVPTAPPRDENAPLNVVVVETGQALYGLVVDGIFDSEEIVVKPLGRHIKDCPGLAGATILGNGRVALILDAAGIASSANVELTHESEEQSKQQDLDSEGQASAQPLLLFSTNPADQFGVPMEIVARIERVRADQIDAVGGQELLQYRGTSLPLISVENHLDVEPRSKVNRLYVIVFTIGDREVGLVAPQLDDIREIACEIDTATFKSIGVAGSLVVNNRAVRLLDVFELAEASHPQWFIESREQTPEDTGPKRILLAEDSSFFRRQVAGFLKNEGFEVLEYEDGLEAWSALSEEGVEVDLVVTDIEMPNMDGFGFCSRIRDDESLSALPVIALTSLSSEADRERGRSVGFSDYQVKMHRENLLGSVRSLLAAKPKQSRANAAAPLSPSI